MIFYFKQFGVNYWFQGLGIEYDCENCYNGIYFAYSVVFACFFYSLKWKRNYWEWEPNYINNLFKNEFFFKYSSCYWNLPFAISDVIYFGWGGKFRLRAFFFFNPYCSPYYYHNGIPCSLYSPPYPFPFLYHSPTPNQLHFPFLFCFSYSISVIVSFIF